MNGKDETRFPDESDRLTEKRRRGAWRWGLLGGLSTGILAISWPAADGSAAGALSSLSAQTVVSAGVCADQAVIPLVPRSRLLAVSPQAADPAQSAVAGQARGLPVVRSSAESLLASGADVVVMGRYGQTQTEALLKRIGVRVVRLGANDRLNQVVPGLMRLAEQLGVPQRGREMTQTWEAHLLQLRRQTPSSSIEAAYFRPDGGSAGMGTYVSEAMAVAGFDSMATRLRQRGWGRLDLETVVMHPPQAMVLSYFESNGYGIHRLYSRHPLFADFRRRLPTVILPGSLWGCGGWPVLDAIERLATFRRQISPVTDGDTVTDGKAVTGGDRALSTDDGSDRGHGQGNR